MLAFVCLMCAIRTAQCASLRDEFRKSIGADVVLIINGDDFGKSLSSNAGVEQATEKGVLTSTTMIMCGLHVPEAMEYVRTHPKMDAGVHLNLLMENTMPPYGPLTPVSEVPSLVDAKGYFHTNLTFVPAMKSGEVEKELEAQIKKALDLGMDVTHIDSHMGFYHGDLRIFKITLKLSKKYGLPMRFPNPGFANTADAAGILTTNDILFDLGKYQGKEKVDHFVTWLKGLKPGIYEVVDHPATFGPDEKDVWRKEDMELTWNDEVVKTIKDRGIRLTGYRALRDFQRARAAEKAAAEEKK